MKYVKCDQCGKKIYVGEKIVQRNGFCGIYCSWECYLPNDPHHVVNILTEELAEDNLAEIKEE